MCDGSVVSLLQQEIPFFFQFEKRGREGVALLRDLSAKIRCVGLRTDLPSAARAFDSGPFQVALVP